MSSQPAKHPKESPLGRRRGLALSGGGALGAWQIGALAELDRAGQRFDRVIGFSAGALNGAAYACGKTDIAVERWSALDMRVLRPAPKFFPFSLCSVEPVRSLLSYLGREDEARRALRCGLTVVSSLGDRTRRVYADFEPNGRWDGPLEEHLLASSAIPIVHPKRAVEFRGDKLILFDGGVPTEEDMSFAALKDCEEVLILEMVREDETGKPARGLLSEIHQRSLDAVRRMINQGAASLRREGVEAVRLAPSRPLGFSMLDFRPANLAAALALGRADARALLDASA